MEPKVLLTFRSLLVNEKISRADLRFTQFVVQLLSHFRVNHPPEAAVDALAIDLKSMVAALRKLRRAWRYAARKTDSRYPKAAKLYDAKLVQMLDAIQDLQPELEPDDGDMEDDQDLLFDVSDFRPAAAADPEAERLQRKLEETRAKALAQLKGASIEILDDEDAEPVQVGPARICSTCPQAGEARGKNAAKEDLCNVFIYLYIIDIVCPPCSCRINLLRPPTHPSPSM